MRAQLRFLVSAGLGVPVAYAMPAVTTWQRGRRRLLPTLAGVGDRSHLALTFDDGPDRVSTPAILDALDRLGWKATFFMLGCMVERDRGLALEVVGRGHEAAIHGQVHKNHLARSPRALHRDLTRARDTVEEATGTAVQWFRPPYGVLSSGSLSAARAAQLQPVLWTAWGRDWRAEATAASVVDDVCRGAEGGGTVLLHDSDCTSAPESWRSTLSALPLLAERWASEPWRVGPLGQHGLALRL